MGSAFAIGHWEDMLIGVLRVESLTIIAAIAATHEELAKLAIAIAIVLVLRRQIDDPADGLLYGALAGLGFAMEESMLYLSLTQPEPQLIGREFVRLVFHAILGGIDGFGIGLARSQQRGWLRILLACLTVSMGVHFLWDALCGLPTMCDAAAVFHRCVALLLMLGSLGIFGYCVHAAHARLPHGVCFQCSNKLWGWPLANLGAIGRQVC
jgi:RsiW-degrading membrane proteinase PrsW (M82 family)